MSNEILKSIYEITSKYVDPLSGKSLDQDNKNLNIIIKNGNINITLVIDPNEQNFYEKLEITLKNQISKIKDVLSVNVILTFEKSSNNNNLNVKEKKFNINSKNIIAVASGKGGVGKSTFASNIAVALNKIGNKVGLLDADIYGPSIPRMMGISDKPKINENNKMLPLENFNIKCMSIGFLIDVDTPTIWRGPMIMKALEQMFNSVEWGSLDYLIIDLPPGTGDAQLSLAQNSKLTGSIIISTPQDVALIDARKAINMFKKVNIPILGLVENMSYFICDSCNEKHYIFSNGGAKKEAINFKVPYLGEIPLDKSLRVFSDKGKSVIIDNVEGEISMIYNKIANKINDSLKN